jgi:hypothetical protein
LHRGTKMDSHLAGTWTPLSVTTSIRRTLQL